MYLYTYKLIHKTTKEVQYLKALSNLKPVNFMFNREHKTEYKTECFIIFKHEVSAEELFYYNQRHKSKYPSEEQIEIEF